LNSETKLISAGEEPSNPQAKKKFNSTLPFSAALPYDPLFAERLPLIHAFSLAIHHAARFKRKRSPLTRGARALLGYDNFAFHAAECGVYHGSSLLACVKMMREMGLKGQFHALDTFIGLPELSDTDRQLAPKNAQYLDRTIFADTSFEAVKARVAAAGVADSVVFHKGLFAETLPLLVEVKYDFVNVDCDLFMPHIECLEYFYPRMEPGGVIFFDDYYSLEFPMARNAIDQFMSDKPELLFHLRMGDDRPNRTKAYLIKF